MNIDKSTAWLLENGSPAVRYLTQKNILGKSATSSFMKKLWLEVDASKEVCRIFDQQKKDGSWCIGGAGGKYDPSEPKYKTTVWILPLMGEMGYTIKDPRVKMACDYVLGSWLFDSPFFKTKKMPVPGVDRMGFSTCRFTKYLLGLSSVGCANHPLVRRGFDLMLTRQREDGGWVSPHHVEMRKGRSCPWATTSMALAMYHSRDKKYDKPMRKAFSFLACHLENKAHRDSRQLYFRGHNMVREVTALADLKIGIKTRSIKRFLNWLDSMYDSKEGCFRYDGKPAAEWTASQDGVAGNVAAYQFRQVAETDWLTYHAVRIALKMKKG